MTTATDLPAAKVPAPNFTGVRTMRAGDIPAAAALKRRVFAELYAGHVSDERLEGWLDGCASIPALERRFAESHRRFLVWTRCGVQLGGAILDIKGDVGYLNAVWVAPEERGKGIGFTLANLREEIARESGCTTLQLHVWDGNPGGIAFAEARGYTWDGETVLECEQTDSTLRLYTRPV